jgi:hypothetical protein
MKKKKGVGRVEYKAVHGEGVKKQHGGRRPGAGRKPPKYPSQLVRIKCSERELKLIQKLGTRERATVLLAACEK